MRMRAHTRLRVHMRVRICMRMHAHVRMRMRMRKYTRMRMHSVARKVVAQGSTRKGVTGGSPGAHHIASQNTSQVKQIAE